MQKSHLLLKGSTSQYCYCVCSEKCEDKPSHWAGVVAHAWRRLSRTEMEIPFVLEPRAGEDEEAGNLLRGPSLQHKS